MSRSSLVERAQLRPDSVERAAFPDNGSLTALCVVGPTASGKTDLALALARELNGEVVSADSRQVYRFLDAGTAKPRRDSDGLVEGRPYHLLDCADPSEPFDAGRFARLAGPLCEDMRRRGRLPIIAGGTGLYVRALLEGLTELPTRDASLRRRLEEAAARKGRLWLHGQLCTVDPVAAQKIPPNNIQRVVRALEVFELTGKPISSFWGRRTSKLGAGAIVLSIARPAEELRRRIAARAEEMWPLMLDEVRTLVPARYAGDEPGFQSLGYRQALECLQGRLSREEGLRALIGATTAYARRQRTWFRHQVSGVEIEGGEAPRMLARALEALRPARA